MTAQWWNTFGLVANIVGAGIVFKFGLPQPDFEEGVSLGLEENTVFEDGTSVAEINTEKRRAKKCHTLLSQAGMSLLIVGFVLQLVGTWT